MTRIRTALDIARPAAEVFAFMTDLENAPHWTVDLIEVRHDGPLREGATGVDVRRMNRRQVEMPWRVTRFEPPRAVAFSYAEPFEATATFTFEPTPTGTLVTCDTQLRLRGLYRLLAPLVAREAAKTDALQFRKAKELLEAGARGGSSARAEPA